MIHPKRFLASATCLLSVLALSACGGGSSFVPSSGLTPVSTFRAPDSDFGQTTVPNIAGKYAGTLTESENGHTLSGTVTFDVNQSGSSISGTVTPTIEGHTKSFKFSGKVSKTVKGAFAKFTIYNSNGRNATGHGTVIGKHFNGKAYVPPDGTKPAVNIAFKTVKQ